MATYTGEKAIDYTNTNPDYWSSVNKFFNEGKKAETGETGIWIPNLEKEGAEATALAATAGGVRAYTGTNYARKSGTDSTDKPGKEKPIRFLEQVKSKLDITNINIIHQSFEKFRDADDIAGIVLKNFSNKQLSKMSYHDKVFTITEVARKNYGTNLPIYFLTGSNALSLNKQFTKNKFTLSEIDTPFFENKRFLLETRT